MPPLLQRVLRRIEARELIWVIGAAGALWAFFGIADEMSEGGTSVIDKRILLALRHPGHPAEPIGSPSFQEAMRDVTALGGVTVMLLVTIVGVLAFLMHRRRWHAGIFAVTVLAANVSSEVLKRTYGRPRPELVPHGSYVYSASFPSGHSVLSAATFLTLAMLISSLEPNRATKVMVFILAMGLMLAVGFSRIYLGVHWPSDVLAGWCLGAACAFAAWTALLRFGRRDVPPESQP